MNYKYKEFFFIDRLGIFVLLQKYFKAKDSIKTAISYEKFKDRDEYIELKKYFVNRKSSQLVEGTHLFKPLVLLRIKVVGEVLLLNLKLFNKLLDKNNWRIRIKDCFNITIIMSRLGKLLITMVLNMNT